MCTSYGDLFENLTLRRTLRQFSLFLKFTVTSTFHPPCLIFILIFSKCNLCILWAIAINNVMMYMWRNVIRLKYEKIYVTLTFFFYLLRSTFKIRMTSTFFWYVNKSRWCAHDTRVSDTCVCMYSSARATSSRVSFGKKEKKETQVTRDIQFQTWRALEIR